MNITVKSDIKCIITTWLGSPVFWILGSAIPLQKGDIITIEDKLLNTGDGCVIQAGQEVWDKIENTSFEVTERRYYPLANIIVVNLKTASTHEDSNS